MSLKSLLTATALATLITTPGLAQVAPAMGGREPLDQKEGVQTPETLGAGRSQARPEGGHLARPADPRFGRIIMRHIQRALTCLFACQLALTSIPAAAIETSIDHIK